MTFDNLSPWSSVRPQPTATNATRALLAGAGSKFDKKDPAGTCGNVVAETKFKHGQFQVGPFEKVVHSGQKWTGRRGVLSFYLTAGILEHFKKYGEQHYLAARNRMYEL